MRDRERISTLFRQHGFDDYKWLTPEKDIIIAEWVRFHCLFGCDSYGIYASCPPAVPAVEECRRMIFEYADAVILHFPLHDATQDDMRKLSARLGKLEREVFLAGYYKAFLINPSSCDLCKECCAEGTREKCRNKKMSRPSAEALGIDVYQTARNAGYPIQVIREFGEPINRYVFLLIQ